MNIRGHKDIVEARRFIFETMVGISKGETSIEAGLAIHKLSSDLMEGYRLQLKAMELASENSNKPLTLKEVTTQLEG